MSTAPLSEPSSVRRDAASRAPDEMTVLLVESHALVRAGLRALLSAADGLAVVAEASTLIEAAESARRHRPDVVLVDGRALGSPDGEELVLVREAAPDSCVLVLADDGLARVGPPRHAHGCVAPTASVQELCATVASLLGSRCANCRFRAACPVPRLAVALSRRERQVAVRVAEGMQSKHIAAALGIRVRTVNTYRESLARKIGASSAAVLTRFVLETGLTDDRGGAVESARTSSLDATRRTTTTVLTPP